MRAALFITAILVSIASPAMRVVHVIVALADNEHQQGIKLPLVMGNGQMPAGNQLWGAGMGMKSHFEWAKEWIRVSDVPKPDVPHILERLIWKHKDSTIYLIADAYDGRELRRATGDLLLYASGGGASTVNAGGTMIPAGGGAALIAFLGHNGLMDFKIEKVYRPEVLDHGRQVIILSSLSRGFFANHIRATGAHPLLWTTGILLAEAYTLRDALLGWVAGESDAEIAGRAARAYDQYKKSGIDAARRLLVSGY
jgi:hypothetical protein